MIFFFIIPVSLVGRFSKLGRHHTKCDLKCLMSQRFRRPRSRRSSMACTHGTLVSLYKRGLIPKGGNA